MLYTSARTYVPGAAASMPRSRRTSTAANTAASARQARALVILQQDRDRAVPQIGRMRGDGRLAVPSQQFDTNQVTYRVRFDPDTLRVTGGSCPDERFRRPPGGCKHMRAAKIWLRNHVRLRV